MGNFRDVLDELFIEKLNYQYTGVSLPTPEIDGTENILYYAKEYQGAGIDVILVECIDRIIEFQKRIIKNQKSVFPNSHFLFVSNEGKVFDLYNNATSKHLKKITYDEIGRNTRLFKEKLQLFDVVSAEDGTDLQINIEKAFDISDKITKKFFDRFKKIHEKLQKAITGINDEKDVSWYASVMMNRIMFIYFLQKHYVIQNNTDFLLDKFNEIEKANKDYYNDFLLPLFFYGFARRDTNPIKQKFEAEFGPVRYLNGGLFYPHHLEKKYTLQSAVAELYEEKALQTSIGINPILIKEILIFLNGYTWYLDSRPMKEDTDINPDVLGFIFEKYINQKELGAYYTKEDITNYISKSTIIPFIFDKMRNNGFFAPDPNPFISNNDDLIVKIEEYIDQIKTYPEIKFLYKNILLELSVLDPSVGSGAFLFSALKILLPIYQKTIYKLKIFSKVENDNWLNEIIDPLNKHSEEYYLTKQIILNNLYGVDIVEEATEICKLRLFLQLASHLPDIKSIEPLPDIDFNIYAGNSLVGGLSWEDLEANYTMDLFTSTNRDNIKADIKLLSGLKNEYRTIQQQDDNEDKLILLKDNIDVLEHRVNTDIKIGIDNPFHWFIDFNNILEKGGFDIVIGNPPYVVYNKKNKEGKKPSDQYKVHGYRLGETNNLYTYMIERSFKLMNENSNIGMIIPISAFANKSMSLFQEFIKNREDLYVSHFHQRPAQLFDGVLQRLSIFICKPKTKENLRSSTTQVYRWKAKEREGLFKKIKYTKIDQNIKDQFLKINDKIEIDILQKFLAHQPISIYLSNGVVKNNSISYRTAGGGYWWTFLNSPFETISLSNKSTYFDKRFNAKLFMAILNSDLFWWWYYINFDLFNLKDYMIFSFRFTYPTDPKIINKFIYLSDLLEKDFIKNAKGYTINSLTKGANSTLTYNNKLSKNLIEDIDELLFDIYGFTTLEKRYIVDYHKTYRMGLDSEEEIDE